MSINSPEQFEKLRACGMIVGKALRAMAAEVRAGRTTAELCKRAGNRTKDLGRAVEREVRRRGFHVVKELGGHGIGRTIHEPPSVPNYADFSAQHKLTEGLVITIEPIIAAGTGDVMLDQDGWTYRTADGSLSAHYEHTIVITHGEPVLLTAA